ncbi:DciA family protein [Stenotrophomonas sp. PSU-St19]
MSEPKSSVRPASVPKPALDAVMADKSGNPLRRALWLDALDRQLRPQLPPPLRSRCRLANVDGEHLVFLVESPVWHAKLRLAEAQLLDAARSIGLKATRVTIKTASPTPTRSPALDNRNGPHAVSAATHKGLRDALACLQDVSSKPKKRS